ncbi:EamA/RhaT family transporter [Psychroserpens sp. XS_ASV72]|uniref:EamA/RhaT family transporter n=1 Tax=Psychroserpens sp. XS_ASV72 TaxID=3241293 RepID=UPI0035129864
MYLILSITASTLIFIIFKLIGRYNINTLQVIVINYIAAFLFGLWNYDSPIELNTIVESKWIYGAIGLGFLFIAIFNVMALTAQRNGLSVASVASKMSVIIPIVFGIYVYKEGVGFQKILGIVLALISVYLTSVKPKTTKNTTKGLWLPILLFFGSGVIDTSIKYLETTYVGKNDIALFSATIFLFAFVIGASILIYKSVKNPIPITFKAVIAGCILGVVNFFSIYYLLRALDHDTLESSTLFTVNNVAIVMISTLLGLVMFKESITKTNWLGIGLAIIAIVMVTLA